jgi:hypothetical protein
LEFGSAEAGGAALDALGALLAVRAADLAAVLTGRAELAAPVRLEPGAADGGVESRGAASAVLGAAADGRPSSGVAVCGGAFGRNANATINAKITANAAAPNTQLNGTAARCGIDRSLSGGRLSRVRSTRIVTAGELLRFERWLRSPSLGGADTGPCATHSAEGCTLRLAKGSRCVDTLRKSKASS